MTVAVGDKLLLSVEEVAAVIGIGRKRLYPDMMVGRLRLVKIGRRRLIPRVGIPEYIALLERESRLRA